MYESNSLDLQNINILPQDLQDFEAEKTGWDR